MKKTLFTFKKKHFQKIVPPKKAIKKILQSSYKSLSYKLIKNTGLSLIFIGNTTKVILSVIGALPHLYLKSVLRTGRRMAYVIQLIGEAVQLLALIGISLLISPFKNTKVSVKIPLPNLVLPKINNIKPPKIQDFIPDIQKITTRIVQILNYKLPAYALITGSALLIMWGSFYYFFLADLPSPFTLETNPLPESSNIFDRNGNLLYTVYNGRINRLPINLSEIPLFMRQATIAIEDQEFYNHNGISVKGILRAASVNMHSEKTQGGSTITQQLVKIGILKDQRRVIDRKLKEAYLALLLEKIYTKDQILEFYLNNAPYGGTAYGIEAAAKKYFSKHAKELTLGESALLASLPSAPSIYSPYNTEEVVYKSNQKHVLDRMIEKGFITQKEADEAHNQELAFYSIENQIIAPHFVFYVLNNLEKKYGKKLVQEGGLKVATTLDLTTQLKAQQIVKDNVEKVEKAYWISNAASLVTEPKTGKIIAMVGSRDYFDTEHDGNVNVTTSDRQPGSSIKVVNYAYALASGKFFPSSILDDSPVSYRNEWETYTPVNYDGKYRGRVTLKQALAMSLNIPAVKVLNTYGPDKMRELGIQMGIKSWKNLKNYGLSLTLGAGEVKMTELATVYGTLANMGKKQELNAIETIKNTKGKIIAQFGDDHKTPKIPGIAQVSASEDESRVLPEYTAYQLTNILSDNAARLPAFGPYAKLEVPGYKIAVKTGTTNNIRDNWTVGYTPDYLVATWVGNNDNKPMNPNLTSGITGAAPIWNEIMTQLLDGKPESPFATPSGMIKVKVCAVNGLLTCARCPKETEEYFVPGTEPKTACYFPSADECKGKKEQMTTENKSPDEISKALVNCPAGSN